MIGRTISHYRITEKLGEGGMGVVYKAEDTKLERTVALKFLPRQALGGDEERERFLREARAAAALDHPGICTIYEIGQADGETFLAMSYVDGKTVREKVEQGPLHAKQAVEIAIQVLDALQEAHGKKITHRDMKSANIMVTERGQAKILDFGLAQLPGASRITQAGSTIGTAAYMSPEQATGAPVDHRSDIWSVGVVLFEMLMGQLPFQGEYQPAILYSIAHEEPRHLIVPERAQGLQAIMARVLRKKPGERYQQASEMAADLRAFLQAYEPSTASAALPPVTASATTGSFVSPAASGPLATAVPARRRAGLWLSVAATVLAGAGFIGWRLMPPSEPAMRDSASIAVLPLENLSGDPDQEFLADGMTEALIAQLAQINNLRVISRTSVMRYKNAGKPLPEIAKELRVDHIVEGSVARGDGRVRVTAQLIDANEDRHLWAQTYDRELRDVLALQSEVAGAIAREVHIKLPRTNAPAGGPHTAVNPQEFELCMRARQYSYEQTASGVALAISTFQQALALDPNCPDAHAGLARTFGYLGVYGGARPRDVMPKAKELALRAISLREATAEAHATLGAVYGFYDWDWEQAQRELVRTLELEPGTATSHYAYAEYFLLPMNRLDEGVVELRRALDLDPISSPIRSLLGRSLSFREDHDAAIKELGAAIARDPNFYWSHWALGMAYAEKKQFGAARAALEKAHSLDPNNPFNVGGLAYLDALTGNREAALKAIAEAASRAYLSPFWVAFVHTGLGDKEAAIRALQAGVEERDPLAAYAGVVPELKSLRADPRFQDLLRQMKLTAPTPGQRSQLDPEVASESKRLAQRPSL